MGNALSFTAKTAQKKQSLKNFQLAQLTLIQIRQAPINHHNYNPIQTAVLPLLRLPKISNNSLKISPKKNLRLYNLNAYFILAHRN